MYSQTNMTNRWQWGVKPDNPDEKDPEFSAYTKIVSSRLKSAEDGPSQAAELAKETAETWLKAAKDKKEHRMIVRRVARGTMRGIAEIGQDVPLTSRFLLKMLPGAAPELAIDAKSFTGWILEGIADVTLMTGPAVRSNIMKMMEAEFPELGPQFAEICRTAKLKQWWTK